MTKPLVSSSISLITKANSSKELFLFKFKISNKLLTFSALLFERSFTKLQVIRKIYELVYSPRPQTSIRPARKKQFLISGLKGTKR